MLKEKIVDDEGIEFILDDEIENYEKGKSVPSKSSSEMRYFLSRA